jgi:hypothetical protein
MIADRARCTDGGWVTHSKSAAPDSPHDGTVEQMVVDEPDARKTADGDPADASRDTERIRREAADLARTNRMIDEWGWQSFPASDPPPTW